MEIKHKDGKIIINDFTRESYFISKQNEVKNMSNSVMKIENFEDYLKTVLQINSYSNVYYNITKACNLSCNYCYSINDNSNVSMNNNSIILDKLSKLNTNAITLIGGEPFCHPHFYEILNSIKSQKSINSIYIVTNGTLINETKISEFKDSRINIQISLDSIHEEINCLTRGVNTLGKVLDGIKLLKSNNINIKVMQVLTSSNINDAKEFYNYFTSQEISCGFFMVKQVEDKIKPSLQQINELLDFMFYEKGKSIQEIFEIVCFAENMLFGQEGFPITHCGAGINTISINPNGDVYPCVKRSLPNDLITNLLLDNAINELIEFRQNIIMSDLIDNKEQCKNCSIKYFCGGGCRAEEYNDIPCEFNCNYFKFAVNYYFSKLYEN